MILIRMALIFLFLSISASADVLDSCFRAFDTLVDKTVYYASAPFALKRKIMHGFSQLGGHRIRRISQGIDIDRDDYLKGLANLAHALEDVGPVWKRIKLDTIFISGNSDITVLKSQTGELIVGIPYDMAAHSFSLDLSIGLLEFGIRHKIKESMFLHNIKNKGLTRHQYKNGLEAFYNALEEGSIPEELSKLREITITRGGLIDSSRPLLSNQSTFRTDLHFLVYAASDLEGMAIAVLESEVGERLARNYNAYRVYYRDIGNVIVSAGANRQTYREVLKKMIKKLSETSAVGLDLRNLMRIHITKAGEEISSRQWGDGLFDLYLPADVILDDAPINFPRFLLPSP